jgi:catechol 2,3-dioxygenase-like lactoylglutathione lyase family enzyme
MTNPITQGAHHIGLTVPDLSKTRSFFVDTLGFDQVGEVPDYPAVFLNDGTTLLTLWQAVDPESAVPFDRKRNIGLHHFALKVDPSALPALHEKLTAHPDVEIEFAPEQLGDMPVQHMMCHIPGGVRMEFIGSPSN